MSQSFTCSNCGAPLDYDGSGRPTMRCPYCKTSIVVPQELRTPAPGVPAIFSFEADSLAGVAGQARETAEIVRLARAGEKLQAIKLFRSTYGGSLQQAKDTVEALAANGAVQFSDLASSSTVRLEADQAQPAKRGGNCLVTALLIVVFVGLVAAVPVYLVGKSTAEENRAAATQHAVETQVYADVGNPKATTTPAPAPSMPPSTPTPPSLASLALSFGGKGSGPGLFEDARQVAVDGAGRIYVGDRAGGRIQVFDSSGKQIAQWNVGNSKTILRGLAANRKGTVYVVYDGTIYRYDGATGNLLGQLSYAGGNRFDAIVAAPDGGLVAMWYERRNGIFTSPEGAREDLVRFDAQGKVTRVIAGVVSQQTEDVELDVYPAVDGHGNLYALSQYANAVFKYTPEGKFITRFGGRGSEPGQFAGARDIAVDGQGRVYVSDTSIIDVFDSNGRFLHAIQASSFNVAFRIVFDDKDNLLIATGDKVIELTLNDKG